MDYASSDEQDYVSQCLRQSIKGALEVLVCIWSEASNRGEALRKDGMKMKFKKSRSGNVDRKKD